MKRSSRAEMEDHFEGERKLAATMSDADLGRFLLCEVLNDIRSVEQEFAYKAEHHKAYARDRGVVREVVYHWLGVKEEWDEP